MRNVAPISARILALGILLVLATAETRGQGAIVFESLTVPQSRLVAGCSLSPTDTVSLGGNRMRVGLWAGLPISSNPWQGDVRSIVAAIRERVVPSPQTPDGPLLSRAELARFRLQLAEDVEEAYAAIYADAGTHLVAVYAVRFKTTPVPDQPRGAAASRGSVRLTRGNTVVVVSGDGQCFDAVATYLGELTAR